MSEDTDAFIKRIVEEGYLPENWNEGPYREGDVLIAGRGCIYPGSQMDGWCYYHDKMYFKPLTPEAEEELKAKGYERVHVTGENGHYLMRSELAKATIGDIVLDLVFVSGRNDGYTVFAEDKNYRLSASHESHHACRWWYLSCVTGTAQVGAVQASPPDIVKRIYAAMPTHHKELPPDSLCFVCGEDTGGKCSRCGRPTCNRHTAWSGEHMYGCWECSEKYCEPCWEAGKAVRDAEDEARRKKQAWLDEKGG